MKFTDAEIDTLQNNLKVAQWNLFSCQQQRNRLQMTDVEKRAVSVAIECLRQRDAYYIGDMDELIETLGKLLERHAKVSVAEVE